MKRILMIISLSICLLMLVSQTNMVVAIDSAPIDTILSEQETMNGLTDRHETNSASETQIINENHEQIDRNKTIPEQNNNTDQPLPENPRQQQSTPSTEKNFNLSPIKTDTDTTIKNIVINALPEIPTLKEADTLSKIIGWWSENPLKMKLWYLFLALSTVLFLFRQTSFRKPLLFASLVIFGFYLGNTVNPINSIFLIPVQTGVKLVDSIVLVALPIILSLFIGRIFCGWICPIGAVQEFLHPENFKLQLPLLLDRIFSYLRFVLLISGVVFSWLVMSNVWNSYDPFQSIFTFKWSFITVVLLFVVLSASIFIERFFCRYLCPLGAVLTITSRFSLLKMRPDSDVCIACGKCSQPGACSMNTISAVNPYTDLPMIEASECIRCYRCANICHYSALKLSLTSKKKVKSVKTQNSGQDLSS